MLKQTGLSLALCLAAGSAYAADANGRFAIKGGGLKNCSDFMEANDTGSEDIALYAGWMDGYLTGINRYEEGVFDLAPWQTTSTMVRLLYAVCQQVPEDTRLIDAFNTLASAFGPARLREESPAEGLRHKNNSTIAYVAVVKMVQDVLNAEGFQTDNADGAFDASTAQALEDYQRKNGLDVTGLPDQSTMLMMFLKAK